MEAFNFNKKEENNNENLSTKIKKKLSQREIGFMYLILGLIIHFLPVIFPSMSHMMERIGYGSTIGLFIISSFLSVIKLALIVVGLIKIFSGNKKIENNNEELIYRKIDYKRAIIWIAIGILLPLTLLFLIPSCKTGEVCHWDIIMMLGFTFMIPLSVLGTIFIVIGIVKLNKYFKYKKIQQNISEENK